MPKQHKAESAAANPTARTVELLLGHGAYQLVFSFRAFEQAERTINRSRALGDPKVNLFAGIAQLQTDGFFDCGSLAALFWASLLTNHPAITIDAARDLLTDIPTMVMVQTAIIETFTGATEDPTAKRPTEGEAKPKAAPEKS